MKNKENEKQERSENKDLECGETRGFSILNRNYPPFLAYDLTPNLPEEPSPKKKTDKEKPASYRDDPEVLKAIEQFKAYATKIRPPME
jgi:hypothetical protein